MTQVTVHAAASVLHRLETSQSIDDAGVVFDVPLEKRLPSGGELMEIRAEVPLERRAEDDASILERGTADVGHGLRQSSRAVGRQ